MPSLSKGQEAPDFNLYDDEKKPFTLSDARGKHNVLLLFYPGAFTGVCTTELNTVTNDISEYGEDTLIVGISTDSPFVLSEFKKVHSFGFPLLSDHNAEVSASYGSKYENDFTDMKLDRISKRSAFIVNKDGLIEYVEVLDNAGNLPDLESIKSLLAGI